MVESFGRFRNSPLRQVVYLHLLLLNKRYRTLQSNSPCRPPIEEVEELKLINGFSSLKFRRRSRRPNEVEKSVKIVDDERSKAVKRAEEQIP